MKNRLLVTLVSISSVVTISLAIYLIPDEKELLLDPEIETHAPIEEGCVENYQKLNSILESGLDLEWLDRPYSDVPTEEYEAFLLQEAETIISNYQKVSHHKDALIEIAANGCITSPTTSLSDPIPKLSEFRDLCTAHFDYWELCNLKDDLDRDMSDILIPYAVALYWIETSRSLAESLTCTAVLRKGYSSFERGYPKASPDDLKAIEDFLKVPAKVAESTAKTLIFEYCLTASAFDLVESQSPKGLALLLYKRNQTLNTYAANMLEQIELAKAKDWDGLRTLAEEQEKELDRFHLKNWGGWQLLRMTTPSTTKIQKMAAETDQAREDLLAKVRTKRNEFNEQ